MLANNRIEMRTVLSEGDLAKMFKEKDLGKDWGQKKNDPLE